MPPKDDSPHPALVGQGTFPTTHWSVVLAARQGSDSRATTALETLCRTYWYPLYAFVRREGHRSHDAADLTQAFFEVLLEKDYLAAVSPHKGKFRSFLLSAIKHFLADQRDKANAQKHGGGKPLISFDERAADECYRLEPAHDWTPEKLFERRWALSLLSTVFDRLAKDYTAAGKGELFQAIHGFLSPDAGEADYSSTARRLQMNEGALRMAVHRLRRHYGELFREEVANTVEDSSQIEDEMRELRRILSQ